MDVNYWEDPPNPFGPCPCQSGKRLRKCCLTPSGILSKKPSSTCPPKPATNTLSKGCYAEPLTDCDGKALTGEHYFSEALLTRFEGGLIPGGFVWAKSGMKLTPKTLTARILCRRHNQALSPLDAESGRLFDAMIGLYHGTLKELRLFSGEDIERWMLKACLGLYMSGNAIHGGKVVKPDPERDGIPIESWLRILYGEESMPEGCGLYYFGPMAEDPQAKGGFVARLERHPENGNIIGLSVWMMSFWLQLSMVRLINGDKRYMSFRLRRLLVKDGGAIEFSWDDRKYADAVQVTTLPGM